MNNHAGLRNSIFIIVGLLPLIGCGRGTLQSVTLKPVRLGVSDVASIHDDTGSGTGGDALLARKDDEVVAGIERFYNPDPVRNIQHAYRGGVQFDLAPISKIKSKAVEKAMLTYKIRQSYIRDSEGKSPDFPNITSCAREAFTGAEDWSKLITSEGYATTALPTDQLIVALPETVTGGSVFNVDVTKAARQWVVSPEQNFGLILKGLDEHVTGGAQNNACATRLGDFSLGVSYAVFEL